MDSVAERYGVTVRRVRALRGPNLYAFMPVLEIIMDIGSYEERSSADFPGFTERLTSWLPGLQTHECSVGRPGGFIERLRRGTYLGHISEHVTLELQNMLGFPVGYGRARGIGEEGVYRVLIAYKVEEVARAAFDTALRLTLAAMNDDPFELESELERLHEIADEYRLDPSTAAIVNAARRRRIPVMRMSPDESLVQLGYGVHQKRIWASQTSNTSSIAVELCGEQPLANHLLRLVGGPVLEGRMVRSAEGAWVAARRIGLPVVVKPQGGGAGSGVSGGLNSEDEVRTAYETARRFATRVLVERFIEGHDYRLLVVNGKLAAAARRDPARVDDDSRSAAGTASDVTDDLHLDNARLAEVAADILGLDVAGIDIVCADISRPLAEQGGAIVGVTAAPDLSMHLGDSTGRARRVGAPIVEMLYPEGAPARIPLIAVTGTNGKTTVTRLVSHMFETEGRRVGMTTTEGIYLGGERIRRGDCSGPRSARAVLLHPRVEVAVLETARGGILREGLGFDSCSVGVVTNVSGDHLGLEGINTVEQLAKVKQVVVENVLRDGVAVLNADDPLVAQMATATEGEVIYFGQHAGNPVITSHRADGKRAVLVEREAIVLADGERTTELISLDQLVWTAGGAIHFQVENALAATAAAWGGGLNPAVIARALTTFSTAADIVPGRFNVSERGGVQVIVDYGHNPAAMRALGQAAEAMGHRHTIMLLGLPGDRTDEDLLATLQASMGFANHFLLYDLPDRRGRARNQLPGLLKERLDAAGVPAEIVATQEEGIAHAWERAKPGDRIILIIDDVDEGLDRVESLAGGE